MTKKERIRDARNLQKIKVGLSLKRVESKAVFPNKFVYIDECLRIYPSIDVIEKRCGLTSRSFYDCVDFKLGVIYDPAASVIFTNTKGIKINEATLNGIERLRPISTSKRV